MNHHHPHRHAHFPGSHRGMRRGGFRERADGIFDGCPPAEGPDSGPRRGFGEHRGGRHGGPGGRRRMFENGQLRLVLLLLLETQPRHGYDLIREFEERTGGTYTPSPGIIYPTLTLLEETGLVTADEAEGRKLFSLTDMGRSQLDSARTEAAAILTKLDQLKARAAADQNSPVFRAMTNLKTVLHQRITAETNRETLFAIADLIDEAARKIERL
jgi:DNA-binding PadR family transcriptional regulator